MKKQILYFSLAALALSACSEQDDFTQADIANAAIENANAGDVPVAFGTYVGTGGTTRSGVIGEIDSNDRLKGTSATTAGEGNTNNGFGVFAFNTGTANWSTLTGDNRKIPNFMYNERVYWDNSNNVWKYDIIKYWPNGVDASNAANDPSNSATQDASNVQKLSFFAYAPYTYVSTSGTNNGKEMENNGGTADGYDKLTSGLTQKGTLAVGITNLSTNATKGAPIVSYSLPASNPTGKNVVDLLWGTRGLTTYEETDGDNNTGTVGTTYNTDLVKQKVDERVTFLFKHALAKIADIKVVYDLDGNGTPTQGYGTDDPNTLVTVSSVTIKPKATAQFYQTGKFNIATGAWDMDGATSYSTDLNIAGTNALDDAVKEPAAHPVYSSGWKYTGASEAFDGVRRTPKPLYTNFDPIMFIPGSSHAPQLTIAITYIVRTYDGKLDTGASDSEGTWSKVTQTITNDVTLPTLAVNTKYSLVMHLGLTSVKFSAKISGWDEGETTEVWLPSNVVNTTAWTLDAGSTQTVHTLATATSYTVNIKGLADGDYTLDTDGTDAGITSTSPATTETVTVASGVGTITLNFTANSSTSDVKSQKAVLKLTPSGGGDATTTTITVIQDKAAS